MKAVVVALTLFAAQVHATDLPTRVTYRFDVVDAVSKHVYQRVEGTARTGEQWLFSETGMGPYAASCDSFEPPRRITARVTGGSSYGVRPLHVSTDGLTTVSVQIGFTKLQKVLRDKAGPCIEVLPDSLENTSAQTVVLKPGAAPLEVGRTPDGHIVKLRLIERSR